MHVVAKKLKMLVMPLAPVWLVVALASPVAAQEPPGALVVGGPRRICSCCTRET